MYFNGTAKTKLLVTLVFLLLVNVHVEASIARTEQVSNIVTLRCIASSLLYKVLAEIYSSDISSCQKAPDQGNLDCYVFSSACFIRQISEHLLTSFATLILTQATEDADLTVVNFYERNDPTGSIEGMGTNLATPIVRDTGFESDGAHKVFADAKDGLSDLVVSRLRICRTLYKVTRKVLMDFGSI